MEVPPPNVNCIQCLEQSEALERLEPLERTDPPDERSEAVEPFDKTQDRLFERLERTDPRDEQSIRLKLSYAAFDVSSNSTFNRAPSAAATLSSVVNE